MSGMKAMLSSSPSRFHEPPRNRHHSCDSVGGSSHWAGAGTGRVNEYFKRHEFECSCGCGFNTVDYELLNVLTDIREEISLPVIITSGARCKDWNRTVGGSKRSMHLFGQAADFKVLNTHDDFVAQYLEDKYPETYGIGRYNGRTHVDVRTTQKARWDLR